jgi:putative addiction module killer protein
LTQAGHDYLPVLFLVAAWGRKHRGKVKLTRFLDAETGHQSCIYSDTRRTREQPGYRVYFTGRGTFVYVLLIGGDKSTQRRDIKRALKMARELKT